MHRLEITGTTPEDLFMNAVRMLSVLLKGGATTVPAEPATDAPAERQSDASTSEDASSAAGASQNLVTNTPRAGESETQTAARRGRKPKGEKPAASETKLNDDISDVGKSGEISSPKELTLDGDIRPRLRAIQKAHAERGHDMPACVAYIQKLYGPFGIAKADQLKPEQYPEFMEASEAYLAGTA